MQNKKKNKKKKTKLFNLEIGDFNRLEVVVSPKDVGPFTQLEVHTLCALDVVERIRGIQHLKFLRLLQKIADADGPVTCNFIDLVSLCYSLDALFLTAETIGALPKSDFLEPLQVEVGRIFHEFVPADNVYANIEWSEILSGYKIFHENEVYKLQIYADREIKRLDRISESSQCDGLFIILNIFDEMVRKLKNNGYDWSYKNQTREVVPTETQIFQMNIINPNRLEVKPESSDRKTYQTLIQATTTVQSAIKNIVDLKSFADDGSIEKAKKIAEDDISIIPYLEAIKQGEDPLNIISLLVITARITFLMKTAEVHKEKLMLKQIYIDIFRNFEDEVSRIYNEYLHHAFDRAYELFDFFNMDQLEKIEEYGHRVIEKLSKDSEVDVNTEHKDERTREIIMNIYYHSAINACDLEKIEFNPQAYKDAKEAAEIIGPIF